MAKTANVSAKAKLDKSQQVPALLGLALLLGLLAILPWLSNQDGSSSFRALQVSVAILLALGGGICLGLQIAANKKK